MAARLRGIGVEAAVPIALLLAWGLWSARAESFFFPPLTDILVSFRDNWLFARLPTDVVPSLERVAAGYALAVGFGIALGVLQAQRSFAIPDMWSGILLLGLLGYATNAVFVVVERRILRWHRASQSSALEQAA